MGINATFLRNALTLGPTVRAHVVPRLFQEFRQQLLVRIRHLKTLTFDDAHTPWTNATPPFSDSPNRHDISIHNNDHRHTKRRWDQLPILAREVKSNYALKIKILSVRKKFILIILIN